MCVCVCVGGGGGVESCSVECTVHSILLSVEIIGTNESTALSMVSEGEGVHPSNMEVLVCMCMYCI